jgi:radical SAM/Cys-rich protein
MHFSDQINAIQSQPLRAVDVQTLQVNIGYRCNMTCTHCHVEAGPQRPESMSLDHVNAVLDVLRHYQIPALDITGGAPELNPHFRYLVEQAEPLVSRLIVRTNLTIFFERGMEEIPRFCAAHGVELVASLPCYMPENVDRVRGAGTFDKSIQALQGLNSLGYGKAGSGLTLSLMFNPQGIDLPPDEASLEQAFREELGSQFGIAFNRLYAITNSPLGRLKKQLRKTHDLEEYQDKLTASLNAATLGSVMCRHGVSVAPDGRLYDCDFNQMLKLPIVAGYPQTITDFDPATLSTREIVVGNHCFACTAAQGST